MDNEAMNPEAWAEATATRTIDIREMDEMVKKNQEMWARVDELKKPYTQALQEAEAHDQKVMGTLREAGKKSYKVDGLGTITIAQTETVRVPATHEQKKKFFDYLRSRGEAVLYTYATVNSQSLNSWYKKESEEAATRGELLTVPGIDGSTMRESLRFTKERKKGQ